MAKFLQFPIAPSVDSGTTDEAPSGANDLTESGQDFLTTVNVGDYVHNVTDNVWHIVSAVVDDENLTLVSGTVAIDKDYTIYSGNTSLYRNQLVSAENIVIVQQASNSTTTIAYSAGGTGTDIITVTHGSVVKGSNAVRTVIQDAMTDLHSGKTKPESFKFITMPTDIIVTGIAVG